MNNSSTRLGALLASAGLVGVATFGTITYAQRRNDHIRFSPSDIPTSMQKRPNLIAAVIGKGEGGTPPSQTSEGSATKSTTATDAADNRSTALVTERLLSQANYIRHPTDATISQRLFDRYLDALDPQRLFFLKSDMEEWRPLRDTVGEKIKENGDTSFADVASDRLKERLATQVAYVQDALKTQKFDFTGTDTIQINRGDRDHPAPRPADLDEAKKLWFQQLRFEYLQELLAHKKPADIVTTLSKRYARLQKTLGEQGPDEIFELYLRTFCETFDPHSDYFGKASTAEFAIQMQAALVGIGAQLESDDGYVKIVNLIPGGPAFKNGKLKTGDKIVGVAQGASGGEIVDVVDNMSLNKVVQLIRGEKGTTVRLQIQPNGADPTVRKTIALVRDEVKLSDRLAKAQLIQMPSSTPGAPPVRLGVIALPSFYGEPGAPHHTTSDIRMLVNKLKQEHVAGIILDLRGNPGGSLEEAAGCAGLFVGGGPVVQSKYSDGQIDVKRGPEAKPAYTGPMVVLTSRTSASAAEIVTGALHDYGRAVVIGDDRTFGKSTVQEQLSLAEYLQRANLQVNSDPGSIHLTIAKYYLPSGHSVQLTGVPSDIVIPSPTGILKVGEATMLNPLPIDSIRTAKFTSLNGIAPYLAALRGKSSTRINTSADFTYLKGEIARLKKTLDEKTLSLNLAAREKERLEANARVAARKKMLAARTPVKETVWPITVADAEKPGLPAPLKPGKTADATTPPASADTSLDDPDATANAKGPVERDMTLDESERILMDIGMGKK